MTVASEAFRSVDMETKGRIFSYNLLSKVFTYPEAETLELNWDVIGVLLKELGLSSIGRDIVSQNNKEGYLEEVQCEYTRLFRSAFPKVPLPPYESVYTDEEGLLWGKSTLEVLKCYREAGLEFLRTNDKNTIPDHIAVELEFMAYLASNELEAVSEDEKRFYREKQKSFLRDHLLKWAPGFFEQVEKETKLDFYRIFARFGRVFLSAEIETLGDGRR